MGVRRTSSAMKYPQVGRPDEAGACDKGFAVGVRSCYYPVRRFTGAAIFRGAMNCLFVSDLHGHTDRYEKLLVLISDERPGAVFLGGDLLPHAGGLGSGPADIENFVRDFLAVQFGEVRSRLGAEAPRLFLILGNDDPRVYEEDVRTEAASGIWEYLHNSTVDFEGCPVYGYSCVPPTPFRLKDWERYDVSRYLDPGDISPEEGVRTVEVPPHEVRYRTIAEDLNRLTDGKDLSRAIFLFHSPPYQTKLDRVAGDGKMIDHVPLDVHVGSIAVRRFIEDRQPLLTLHGHIHESPRLTGDWREKIGRTHMFSAAHDGPELCVVRFDPERLEKASRELL